MSTDPGAEAGKRARREQEARAALTPLAAGERPRALLVAVAVSGALALAVLAGALSDHHLSRHGGSLAGAVFLAAIFALLAQGMYRLRYLAVLSFEGLLAFQIIVTSLALMLADTILAAVLYVIAIALGGWLFWKLIRIMGRIQVAEKRDRTPQR